MHVNCSAAGPGLLASPIRRHTTHRRVFIALVTIPKAGVRAETTLYAITITAIPKAGVVSTDLLKVELTMWYGILLEHRKLNVGKVVLLGRAPWFAGRGSAV